MGDRLGDGPLRRLGRLRDDRSRHEIHGPRAGGSLPGPRRGPRADDAAHHLAAGPARRARGHHLRLCRDAGLVLGGPGPRAPNRFYVVTTAMYQLVSQYPPRFPTAAAMGVSLFAVMFVMVWA